MEDLKHYESRAARALVIMHETQLRQVVDVWKKARAANVQLPETSDTDYESLETLLKHLLGAARNYMVWMCKQLDLADPEIKPPPSLQTIEKEADSYSEHLLERWRLPLANVAPQSLEAKSYTSNWGDPFTIDGMLEHAVMHPMRHAFQLQELINKQS